MPHSAEISRTNPSCFLFVIDQSGSMSDPMPDGKAKAQGVSDAINRLLQNLVIRCAKSEGVRDYYHVGVIGYGGQVGPAFAGTLAGRTLVPVSEIGNNPVRIEERTKKSDDGAGGLVEQQVKFPIWFEPKANNGTPMCQALALAKSTMEQWILDHPASFPPTVVHITDGESTDGDPQDFMSSLRNLASADGPLLLFNLHLSANPNATSISFPNSPDNLPDQYSRLLYDGASTLTPFMRSIAAADHKLQTSEGARGFVLNADLTLVIQALDIGTRASNLR